MNPYLKLRTVVVVIVLAVFAFAIHPLTPRDFYQTFRETLREGEEVRAEALIEEARKRQSTRSDLYPAAAMLEAAETNGQSLCKMVNVNGTTDNGDVIAHLRKKSAGSIRLGLDLNGGVEFVLNLKPDYDVLAQGGISRAEAEKRINQNFQAYRDLVMESLRKRLESLNIFESEITPFGERALSLKAPLVSKDEKDKLRQLIQMSNKLEFRLVHPRNDALLAENSQRGIPGYEVMREVSRRGDADDVPKYVVARRAEMTGNNIEKAFVSRSEFGQIAIALRFNSVGAKEFADVTRKNLNQQLAIVLDGKLYCAPVIRSEITGGQAEISGKFSTEEAQLIADALTSGSFPFKIDVAAVYDTDPTLGADNVQNGIWAGLFALALLGTFMIVYYHKAGVIAVIALSANVVLILGGMAAFGATMTMPGIAGVILTLGMAVDANVLVFERMREETERGKSPDSVVSLGFSKAYSSVLDGNLTTLVVALILMYFGTGAVKGFAVSLSIGIIFSLFTALFMSRVIFDWLIRYTAKPKFTMMKFFSRPSIDFLRQSRIAVPLSLILIGLSIAVCALRGKDMLAVDLTGGTQISYNYERNVPVSDLEKFLADSSITAKVTYKSNAGRADNKKVEILVRHGSEQILGTDRMQIADNLSQKLKGAFPALQLTNGQSTVVGGMVGAEMTQNAIISLLLAFLGMLIYVSIRYEWDYAVAGILALVHDVIISTGIFVLMGRELSLPVVAGILTIVGYSINDTIVIFDRIREEKRLSPSKPFPEVVNYSLNQTLSRTILTSLTTFLVVAVMFFFGGIAINDFVLIIMLGIVVGSYSSLYIASPLIVAYQNHKNHTRIEQK